MPNRPLTPADAPALERFLCTRFETSLFLINNLRASGIVDGSEPFQARYRASFAADGAVTAVAAHCWNGILLLQAPVEAGSLATALLAPAERPLAGIVGPVDQVGEALAVVDAPTPPLKDSTEVLYALALEDLLPPVPLASGALAVRAAGAPDIDTVGGWRADYEVELHGRLATPALRRGCRREAARYVSHGTQWLLQDGERPLAGCTFSALVDDCVQIGGVWTPRALRGRGHARAVVAGALLAARERGARRAILFTARDNAPARRAYEAIGFAPIGDYRLVIFPPCPQ